MVQDINELIKKFFDGQCSPEEKIILNEWYHSFDDEPDPEEITDENRRVLYEQLMLERINRNIGKIEGREDFEEMPLRKTSAIRYISYIIPATAAAILLFIGIGLVKKPAIKVNQAPVAVNQKLILENHTSKIQRYVLSDGSIAWLSPASKITALKYFEKDKRELALDGMAFFEVTKNKARPFIIQTSTLTTKVWGTSFTVNAYKNNPVAKVSVLTGKVSVTMLASAKKTVKYHRLNEVILLPHQSVIYSDKSAGLKLSTAVPDLNIWKKINMSFDNAKMDDVIKVLDQKFNVNITVSDDKINGYLFIADLSEQNLPSILEILKTSLDLNYEIQNNEIILRSNQ